MMEKQIDFLVNSINDSQGIIKAIDTKIGVLIVFLSFPLTYSDKMYDFMYSVLSKHSGLEYLSSVILISTFLFFWLISLYIALKGIIAIGNPADSIIKNAGELSGIFYGGDLFKYNYYDIFRNNNSTKSKRSLEDQMKMIPNTEEKIVQELVYEQMKVIYIRDIKIYRLNASFYFTLIWAIEGVILYLLSK